jgi:polar amino acid transport system substrate-binding protein
MKLNLTWKKIRNIGFILLFLVLIVLGVRACSDKIRVHEKVYVIAHDASWYPLDLRGKAQNMVAFCHEVLRSIAAETDFEVAFLEVGASTLYDGLRNGYYDAVISSRVPNSIYRREFAFSDALYPLGPVLVVKFNSKFMDVTDLKGKIIGVETGAQQLYQITEETDFVMIPYRDIPLALESLDRDVIDAVLMDVLPAYTYTQAYYKGRLKVATCPLIDGGIRLATLITPHNEKFINEFNIGLKKIRDKGTYDTLLKKWDLVKTELKCPEKEIKVSP